MDLLACSHCTRRFYVAGIGQPSRCCPRCGGGLDLAVHGMTSIPLDARWLDPGSGGSDSPEVTVVELRRKRQHGGKTGRRIVRNLSDYFAVKTHGQSVEVSVNRGAPVDAALRVAAVLDGVDTGWEEHFYLPTAEVQGSTGQSQRPPPRPSGHLRLVPSEGNGFQSFGPA